MAQPIYFLARAHGNNLAPGGNLNHDYLRDYGLDETFRDVIGQMKDCTICPVHGNGPEGLSGMVIGYHTAAGRPAKRCRYDDSREWVKVSDRVWIGINRDDPPTEEDLRRRRMVGGTPLEIQGGHWTIPMIRSRFGDSQLPRNILFTDDGVGLPVKPEFIKYFVSANDIIQWFYDPVAREQMNDRDMAELAIFHFGLNYRYGKLEQNVLGLIDTENVMTVLAWNVELFKDAEIVT